MTVLYATSFAKVSSTSDWNVNPSVQIQFKQQYGGAENVTWDRSGHLHKANFTLNNAKYTAFYTWQGNFIATTKMINKDQLSESALQKINSKYSGYTIGQIVEYNDGSTVHFVQLTNDKESILVRVMPTDYIYFFKQL